MKTDNDKIKARGYIITSEDIFAPFVTGQMDHILAYNAYRTACPECGHPASGTDRDKMHCRNCGTSW
jgi:hypothetical protein